MARKVPWLLLLVIAVLLTAALACGLGSAAPQPSEAANASPSAAFVPLSTPTLALPSPPSIFPTQALASATAADSYPPTPTLALLTPPAPTVQPVSQPAIREARKLTLDWPAVIRAGDADVVSLTLELDANGNLSPTATYAGHVAAGQTVYIPDVYQTHTVIAEARLDLAGLQAVPSGMASQPLSPGQSVTFYWSVRPESAGMYRGVVLFFLRFVPLAGGPESERELAAFPIDIEVVSLLGVKAGPARVLGAAGVLLSSILGIPFLEDVLRWLWRRIKRA